MNPSLSSPSRGRQSPACSCHRGVTTPRAAPVIGRVTSPAPRQPPSPSTTFSFHLHAWRGLALHRCAYHVADGLLPHGCAGVDTGCRTGCTRLCAPPGDGERRDGGRWLRFALVRGQASGASIGGTGVVRRTCSSARRGLPWPWPKPWPSDHRTQPHHRAPRPAPPRPAPRPGRVRRNSLSKSANSVAGHSPVPATPATHATPRRAVTSVVI